LVAELDVAAEQKRAKVRCAARLMLPLAGSCSPLLHASHGLAGVEVAGLRCKLTCSSQAHMLEPSLACGAVPPLSCQANSQEWGR